MKIAKLIYNKLEEILEDQQILPSNTNNYQYVDITNYDPTPTVGQIFTGSGFKQAEILLTKTEFRDRFTLAEKIAIDNLETNENIPAEVKLTFKTAVKDFEAADTGINLLRPDVIQVVQAFEVFGLVSSGRAMEILS